MPKERITKPTYYYIAEDGETIDAPPGTTQPMIRNPELIVHWGKPGTDVADGPAGHVQIELDIDAADLTRRLETGANSLAFGFFTDTLARDDLNRLIRVLRRARDQALGADE